MTGVLLWLPDIPWLVCCFGASTPYLSELRGPTVQCTGGTRCPHGTVWHVRWWAITCKGMCASAQAHNGCQPRHAPGHTHV